MQVVFKKSFLLLGLISLISCHRSAVSLLPEQRVRFSEIQPIRRVSAIMPDAPDHSVKPTCSVSSSKQDTAEVLVRNDNKINTDNAVRQRFRHTKIWLDSPSASIVKASSQSNESRRMTGLQRLLLKKITKRLSHQRSSVNPAKPVLVEGILVLGAVLLLGGILLVLLASGTGFAVGVIALAAGLVCLLIGLF